MMKIKLRKKDRKESDFVYKWAMEWCGRSVEFGISQEEFSNLSEKTRALLERPKRIGAYLGSFRQNIKSGRTPKPDIVRSSKKNSTEEKEVTAS